MTAGIAVDRWYLTFHGGDGHHALNAIHAFDPAGQPLGDVIAAGDLPAHVALRELRGLAFGPDGDLYVANAWRRASQVLRFGGSPGPDGRHPFHGVFTERHHRNPGLSHPFDVTFGPDGHLYVSSQDSNVVGRYYGPTATEGAPGTPMPHPPALAATPGHALPPGTFVPARQHHRHGLRSVRRAIFGPDGDLYVADRDGDRVNRYDGATGALRRDYRHRHLTAPVHLAFRPSDGALLVGSRDAHAIYAIDPPSGETDRLVAPGAGGLRAPAGMAFGPDGGLYVCSRETRQVLRFDAGTGVPDPAPFIDGLGDAPEFIMLVPGQHDAPAG